LKSWRAVVGGNPARRRHGGFGRRVCRPRLEALEDRCVPTTFTVTVGTDSPNGMGSGTSGDLRYCIGQANLSTDPDGDTIVFDPSVNAVSLTEGTLRISDPNPLSIEGLPDCTTISGNNTFGIFQVNSGRTVSFDHLLITGGKAGGLGGGGILNEGTLSLDSCSVDSNTASSALGGGGISNADGGTLTLTNCTLDGNSAGTGTAGGGIWSDGTLTLDNCLLEGNASNGGGGGGIHIFQGTVTLENCTLLSNTTNSNGGGIDNIAGATLTLIDCTLDSNVASSAGGGIINAGTLTLDNCSVDSNTGAGIDSFRGTLTLTGCTLNNNSGGSGLSNGGTGTLDGCTIDGNSAVDHTIFGGFGGGISNSGTLTLSNCAIDNNEAGTGGGISNGGTLTLSNCTVDSNTGSGIDNGLGATLTLIDCTLDSNVVGANPAQLANHSGGAILNHNNKVTLIDCTLTNNSADSSINGGGEGGGIYNGGTLMMSGCTLANNRANFSGTGGFGFGGSGGGILNSVSSTLTLSNCTLVNNSASSSGDGTFGGDGGGIENVGTATVIYCTMDNNSATISGAGSTGGHGGGLHNNSTIATLTVVDSIVAANSASSDADISGAFTDAGHNLLGTALQGTANGPGDVFSDDPGLAPLGDNGGPTQTQALLPNSLALGAGAALTSLTSDVDGSSTTMSVANAALLGVIPGFTVLQIDAEQVLVTAVNGNVLTVTRGYNNTNADNHAAGAEVNLATDQRGESRPVADQIDIGAYQSQ
jgi:hypothetical protein